MTQSDLTVLESVLDLLSELADDWEYDGPIEPDLHFLADLGLQSLDIVVLSTMIQEQHGRLPFPEWFEELGQRPVEERDITVSELVAFICEHRQPTLEEV